MLYSLWFTHTHATAKVSASSEIMILWLLLLLYIHVCEHPQLYVIASGQSSCF